MILLDTNIFIEIFKGNKRIIKEVKSIGLENIALSIIVKQELIFGARDKRELNLILKAINKHKVFYLTEAISKTSMELMFNYSLSHKLTITDSLIAATALIYDLPLYTLNIKDFKNIPDLKLHSP